MIPEFEIIKFGKYKDTAYHIIQKKDPKYAEWLNSIWIPKEEYHQQMEKEKKEARNQAVYLKRKKERESKSIKIVKPKLEHYFFTEEFYHIKYGETKNLYIFGYSNHGEVYTVQTEEYKYTPVSGIYLLESDGLYKIGKSNDVANRFKNHKTSNPLLKFVGFIHTKNLTLETELHFKFREFEYTKEWFHKNDVILNFFTSHKDYINNPDPENPSRNLKLNLKDKVVKIKQASISKGLYNLYSHQFLNFKTKTFDYVDDELIEKHFYKCKVDAVDYETGKVCLQC